MNKNWIHYDFGFSFSLSPPANDFMKHFMYVILQQQHMRRSLNDVTQFWTISIPFFNISL